MFAWILVVVCGALLCGVAVKQASYILMHGSIFLTLRQRIESGMNEDRFGFEKLNELFTCKVCMNTQVAIWLVAVPLMFSGLLPNMPWYCTVATFLLVAFAVSGLAVWFWNLSEFRAQKFEVERERCETAMDELRESFQLERQRYESALSELRQSPIVGDVPDGMPENEHLTKEQFVKLVTSLESTCRGIGCGYARRDCRTAELRRQLDQIEERGGVGPNFNRNETVLVLREILADYFRDRWRYKGGNGKLARFREQMFNRYKSEVL